MPYMVNKELSARRRIQTEMRLGDVQRKKDIPGPAVHAGSNIRADQSVRSQ